MESSARGIRCQPMFEVTGSPSWRTSGSERSLPPSNRFSVLKNGSPESPSHPPHLGTVEWLAIPVEGNGKVRFRNAGAGLVNKRQAAASGFGDHFPVQCLEKGRCVFIGDRQHGNLGDGLHLINRQQFFARNGADSWGLRISWVDGQIKYTASLHTITGTHRPFGISIGPRMAVVLRVREDDRAHVPVLDCDPWLDTAEGLPVTHKNNTVAKCRSSSTGTDVKNVHGFLLAATLVRCFGSGLLQIGLHGINMHMNRVALSFRMQPARCCR